MRIKTDYKFFDMFSFNDDLQMQMNNGTKFLVIDIVEILTDVKWYDNNIKAPIFMKDAASSTIIVPVAQGWLRVQANTKKRYILICYVFTLSISYLLYCMKRNCQGKL